MRYRIAIVGLSSLLAAGCSNAPSSVSSVPAAQLVQKASRADELPAGESRLVFSSSSSNNTVQYYLKGTGPNNPVAGSLSGTFSSPEGIGIGSGGDIYVANTGAKDVLVYPAGSTYPTSTLDDPNEFPADVAVGSDGTVFVANVFGPMGIPGDVTVYAPKSDEPTKTLKDACFLHVMGVALDRHGNLFVSCNARPGSGFGSVIEFKAGSTKGTPTHIKLANAGGVGFDGAGHLLVIDSQGPTLNVYNVGSPRPIDKLALPGAALYFSFNRSSTELYVADYSLGEIEVFRYTPRRLKEINKITNGMSSSSGNIGIADTPAQQQ